VQARLERFDALMAAALAIQDENSRAMDMGRLAKGLGAVEDAQARLERFDALMDATLAIQAEDSLNWAIDGLAKGFGAIEDVQARLERFDALKDAALAIQDEDDRAYAIIGLAKGLGAIEPQHRLQCALALKTGARVSESPNTRAAEVLRELRAQGARLTNRSPSVTI
jgi:hypothetical protein